MGQSTVINWFSPSTLLMPAIHPDKALRSVFPVELGPSVSIARGNLLVPGSSTAVNDVQTITEPSAGTFTLSGINPVTGVPFTTASIAYNASDAAIQAAIVAALGFSVAAVASKVVTFSGAAGSQPVALMTMAMSGGTGGAVAHTTTGSRAGVHSLYAGSGTPNCLLKTDISTDAFGNVTYGLNGGIGDQQGGTFTSAPAYFAGAFYAAEIPNLDANAISTTNARFIAGSLGAAGAIIDFP